MNQLACPTDEHALIASTPCSSHTHATSADLPRLQSQGRHSRVCVAPNPAWVQGIHFTAYSPIGRVDNEELITKWDIPHILKQEEVLTIAKDVGKSPEQVIYVWPWWQHDRLCIASELSASPAGHAPGSCLPSVQLPSGKLQSLCGIWPAAASCADRHLQHHLWGAPRCSSESRSLSVQVLLRWGMECGTSCVPKSTNHQHQKSNLDVFSWSLNKDQIKTLNNIEPQVSLASLYTAVDRVPHLNVACRVVKTLHNPLRASCTLYIIMGSAQAGGLRQCSLSG